VDGVLLFGSARTTAPGTFIAALKRFHSLRLQGEINIFTARKYLHVYNFIQLRLAARSDPIHITDRRPLTGTNNNGGIGLGW